MSPQITLQQLAENLGGNYWEKGNLKRVYLDEGHNTKKMSTKTFVWQNEDGEFIVSCKVECPSQPWEWCKSQEDQVKQSVSERIQQAIWEINNPDGDYYEHQEQVESKATEAQEALDANKSSESPFVGDKDLLSHYVKCLFSAKKAEQERVGSVFIGRVEATGQKCRTIWLPSSTSNRSVSVDLNHEILGFDEKGLWGANGNCGTSYIIIDAPIGVEDKDMQKVAEEVNKRLGNKYRIWYDAMRASEARIVREVVYEMFGNGH